MANQWMFRRIRQLAELAVVVMLVLGGASATLSQESATILGTVKDPSGSAVPEATVTARNIGTAEVRTTVTEADGNYRIPALPIGNYEVRIEKAGFTTPFGFTVACFPHKVKAGSGGWTRAVALFD